MSEGNESLGPQMGTDPIDISMGRVDMRRLTVLGSDKMGAVLYAAVRARSSPTWATILDWYLNTNVSIGGRGRRDVIRMEGVSRGGSASVEGELAAARPESWVQRNVTQRDWKSQKLEELGEGPA
jgi:hypothetical protein